MTRDELLTCIEANIDAFRKTLLAKPSKIPPNWDDMEIKQWVMDSAKGAWLSKMDKTRTHRYGRDVSCAAGGAFSAVTAQDRRYKYT